MDNLGFALLFLAYMVVGTALGWACYRKTGCGRATFLILCWLWLPMLPFAFAAGLRRK